MYIGPLRKIRTDYNRGFDCEDNEYFEQDQVKNL